MQFISMFVETKNHKCEDQTELTMVPLSSVKRILTNKEVLIALWSSDPKNDLGSSFYN